MMFYFQELISPSLMNPTIKELERNNMCVFHIDAQKLWSKNLIGLFILMRHFFKDRNERQ